MIGCTYFMPVFAPKVAEVALFLVVCVNADEKTSRI